MLARGYPDGGVERFGYTAGISGATSYTNPIGNAVLYKYDPAGRKTNEVYLGVSTNSFTYAPAGDLTKLTDGKLQITTWKYDIYGRVTNKVDDLGTNLFFYAYDPGNRLTNRVSAAKGTTVYRYDRVGNLTNVIYPISPTLQYSYDPLNRLTNMVDGVGATRYSYDAASQILSEDGPWADDAVSYSYQNRSRTGLGVQAPNASPWSQSYAYDSIRRLSSLTSPAGAFGYQYVGTGPSTLVSRLSMPSGSFITNTFDSVARVLTSKLLNPQLSTLNSHQYGYNAANQRTQQLFTAGNYVDYTYDAMGQLKTAKGKEPGGATNRLHEQFGYTYDAAGNLNYRTNDALTETFKVNSLNQLTNAPRSGKLTVAGTTTSQATNVTVNAANAVLYADWTFASTNHTLLNGNNTFTAIAKDSYGRTATVATTVLLPAGAFFIYDQNGNLLSERTGAGTTNRCFAWDDENQLVSVWVTNQWRSDFAYDGKMRRRVRREYSWSSGIGNWQLTNEVRYVYDGNLAIQERDGNNLPQVTYTRGSDLSGTMEGAGGIGGLLARVDHLLFVIGDSRPGSYYHADANGNVTCLINSSNAIVAKYEYDPYGNILSKSGPLADANLYRFSSKELHANSGLVYYLYRFYDPNLQRWINRDPLWESGFEVVRNELPIRLRALVREESGGADLYTFLGNRTGNAIDPIGLTWSKGLCGAILRRMANLYEQIESNPDAWNIEILRRKLDDLDGLWNRFCKEPPEPPKPPEPPPVPYPVCPYVWNQSGANSPSWTPPGWRPSPGFVGGLLLGGAMIGAAVAGGLLLAPK